MVEAKDYEPRYDFQGDEVKDPFIGEGVEDDPTELFGVPPEELAKELDGLAIDEDLLSENEAAHDDAEARMEDLDEDVADVSPNKAM